MSARTRAAEEVPAWLNTAFSEATSHKAIKSEGEEVLRVENVRKIYKRRAGQKQVIVHAVSDVSFSLRAGQVIGLVGQSGSGKTTIARLITATEHPDSGAIWFGSIRADRLK